MDIKDRGLMKWQGFFMPEHVSSLKEVWHDDKKEDKPSLDEYQLQEMDEKIHISMEYNLPLSFTIWMEGHTEEMVGVIHYIDRLNKQLRIKDYLGNVILIDYENLVEIDFG